jgi:hypothetical protein
MAQHSRGVSAEKKSAHLGVSSNDICPKGKRSGPCEGALADRSESIGRLGRSTTNNESAQCLLNTGVLRGDQHETKSPNVFRGEGSGKTGVRPVAIVRYANHAKRRDQVSGSRVSGRSWRDFLYPWEPRRDRQRNNDPWREDKHPCGGTFGFNSLPGAGHSRKESLWRRPISLNRDKTAQESSTVNLMDLAFPLSFK